MCAHVLSCRTVIPRCSLSEEILLGDARRKDKQPTVEELPDDGPACSLNTPDEATAQ